MPLHIEVTHPGRKLFNADTDPEDLLVAHALLGPTAPAS